MGFFGSVWDAGKGIVNTDKNILGKVFDNSNADAASQANKDARAGLQANAGQAGAFAGQAQGNYNAATGGLNNQVNYLQGIQNGTNSVSALQLQQALQQQQGLQQSMAAGASPQNAAMAARTAAIQSGRLGAANAGQQALAGIQERNAAGAQIGSILGGMRGQDVQGALGGYGAANAGYGGMINQTGDQSWLEQNKGAISGLGALITASDRRLKTDIKDGDSDAAKLLQGLKAYSYNYKNPDAYGRGKQLGVMAQDLERGGLKQAVIDTPRGKMVDGAKLALGLAAVLPGLDERIKALECEDGHQDGEDDEEDDDGYHASSKSVKADPKALGAALIAVIPRGKVSTGARAR